MPQLVGGTGEVKPADETVHGIVSKISDDLKVKVAEKRPELASTEGLSPKAVAYKTQLVAGTNFFIKIKLIEGEFIHARVYRDLQGQVSLHSVSDPKTEEDDIIYF